MPQDNNTLEAQLLKKAISIGPDPFGRSRLTLGQMPLPSTGAPAALLGDNLNPVKTLADLLLSRALGAARDRLPPTADILPRLMNKVLPEGERYPLSTDPKLDK